MSILFECPSRSSVFWFNAANKYYSSTSHHEQENQKTTGQIKFSVVTIKQQIKLVLQHFLCKNKCHCIGSNVAAA